MKISDIVKNNYYCYLTLDSTQSSIVKCTGVSNWSASFSFNETSDNKNLIMKTLDVYQVKRCIKTVDSNYFNVFKLRQDIINKMKAL